jgi:hypothetical protein
MSIHFKLNRDATTITISRHSYVNKKGKTEKLITLDFNEDLVVIPDAILDLEEYEKAINWINNQRQQIEDAYRSYARMGYVGGTPAIAETGKHNAKYKHLPLYNGLAPAYSFLGCIKGARKLPVKTESIEFNEIIDSKGLPDISKNIIAAYLGKLISNPDQLAHKNYERSDIEQLVEANLLLSRFITLTKVKQARVKKSGVLEKVDQYFNELLKTDEGYLIGKKLKVKTLLNQKSALENKKDEVLVASGISEERKILNEPYTSKLYVAKPEDSRDTRTKSQEIKELINTKLNKNVFT